ncbi:major facilitator superfamily domain-containing protein [Xylariales sp. PMI_506]|nr:major facilitator superfamily domain-containing protein [Xylariales sp. PMI_506]
MADATNKKVDTEHASSADDALATSHMESKLPPAGKESHLRGLQPPPFVANLTPEQRLELETRLKRKIDLRLLPMIVLMYILNYIDRNNIAAAKLANLEKDLGLPTNSTEYQVSEFFLVHTIGHTYLLMQIPSNLFLNKIGKPSLYLPTCMIVWGTISAATAAVKNFGGLIAVRFFLGFVEAAYFPGCLYYLSCWYTRKELGLRTAMLYSGALISGAFSGLMSAGITANMNGARGIAAWQWLFIIEGVITIGVAFAAYFVLPDFPRTTRWLTEEEKALAIWRLEEDIGEDDWIDSEHQTFWQGAKLAFEDIKTYVLLVHVFCIVSSGSVTNFFPTVVATLGYSNVVSLLLTAPPYVLCVIATFINAWHADKTGERYWHIAVPLAVNVIANIIAATTTTLGPRYLSMMLMVPGVYCAFVVSLAWISNTLPRPPAKRAAALAFINAVSNSSSIYASYMYPNSAGPRYIVAMSVNCCTSFIAIVAATVLRFILVRLNKKLEAGIYVEGAVNALPGEAAHHGFRFKY